VRDARAGLRGYGKVKFTKLMLTDRDFLPELGAIQLSKSTKVA
jgi:hypothetical protein